MHVKGLDLPIEVEEVLDACIEPPGRARVTAAVKALETVGALDSTKRLTSLGKVLLQLPVEAAIGKMCLMGCFFNCLGERVPDQAVHAQAIVPILTDNPFHRTQIKPSPSPQSSRTGTLSWLHWIRG